MEARTRGETPVTLHTRKDETSALAGEAARAWTASMIHPLADRGVGTPASFVARDFALDAVRGDETLVISALGLYRGLHQRPARRRGPADPRLDLLRQAPRLPDLSGRRAAAPGRQPDRDLAGRRLVPLADHVGARGHLQLLGRQDRRDGRDRRRRRGAPAHRRHLEERRAADPAVGHLFRRDLRRPRRKGAPPPTASRCCPSTPACSSPRNARRSGSWRRSRSRESWTDRQGRTIYDFGQNAAGYVAFEVRGAPGARVIVEHAEIVDRDREFDNRNFRSAEARIEYVLKGGGLEAYRPHFTFQGFRYARVTIEGDATLESIEFVPISSVERGDGELRVRQPAGQPAGAEHALVAALQLHRGADRLPAARRAAGLDRRRPGLRARPPATCTTATPSSASTCAT